MRQTTISPSQMDALSCRLSWYWQYACGYSPKRKTVALELGTGIHLALEKYYGKKQDPIAVFAAWAEKRIKDLDANWDDDKEELYDMKALGCAMLEGYLKEYKDKDDFDVLATEETLTIPLLNPATGYPTKCALVVRLDGIVRDHYSGKIFSMEHKTFSTFQSGYLDKDHQMTAQVLAGKQLLKNLGLDEPIVGVIYNGLRKQAPSPRVKTNLFERHKIYRTENHIQVFLTRAYWAYKEISQKRLPIYPEPNAIRCNSCSFKEVCTEYQSGGDFQFILDNLYQKAVRQN